MSNDYEFTMITNEGCTHCASAKERLKDKINSGKIKVLNIATDDEALDLANKYGVNSVPTIIVNNKASNLTEACELKNDLTGVICKDNKEVNF